MHNVLFVCSRFDNLITVLLFYQALFRPMRLHCINVQGFLRLLAVHRVQPFSFLQSQLSNSMIMMRAMPYVIPF
jgi:hypothetical protein